MLMYTVDLSFPTPEENLAYDDALLDLVETERSNAFLRFWQTSGFFVVLGHGNKVSTEVNIEACEKDNVPIFRRQSGGGTILQGKGVLNYSLILPVDYHPDLNGITSTNHYVMSQVSEALQALDPRVYVNGITDIVLEDKKIIGNAQRRKRHAVLFHGCILVSLDLSLISKYLSHPSDEPDYRQSRSHDEFLTHLPFSELEIKAALSKHWNAKDCDPPLLNESVSQKIEGYYAQKSWNYKF